MKKLKEKRSFWQGREVTGDLNITLSPAQIESAKNFFKDIVIAAGGAVINEWGNSVRASITLNDGIRELYFGVHEKPSVANPASYEMFIGMAEKYSIDYQWLGSTEEELNSDLTDFEATLNGLTKGSLTEAYGPYPLNNRDAYNRRQREIDRENKATLAAGGLEDKLAAEFKVCKRFARVPGAHYFEYPLTGNIVGIISFDDDNTFDVQVSIYDFSTRPCKRLSWEKVINRKNVVDDIYCSLSQQCIDLGIDLD